MIPARHEHRFFFLVMGLLALGTALAGFSASYLLPVSSGSFLGPSILHLHALTAFLWLLLFVVQAWWVAAHQMAMHRMLGRIGVVVAISMIISGLMVAATNMHVGIMQGSEEGARRFATFPVTIMLLFAGFLIAALVNVHQPGVHRRLMLVATIMTLPPAAGRIVGQLLLEEELPRQIIGAIPASLTNATIASIAADMLLLVAIVLDWRRSGRPHPVYVYSLLVILAVQGLRLPISGTDPWRAATDLLLLLRP